MPSFSRRIFSFLIFREQRHGQEGKAKNSQKANREINAQKIDAETFTIQKGSRVGCADGNCVRVSGRQPPAIQHQAIESHDDDGDGSSSTTTGLNGTLQNFDDGSTVIEATENLTAKIPGSLDASLSASCRRVQRSDTTIVHQVNYSYKQRALPEVHSVVGKTNQEPLEHLQKQPILSASISRLSSLRAITCSKHLTMRPNGLMKCARKSAASAVATGNPRQGKFIAF
jgi:hypothetical protein